MAQYLSNFLNTAYSTYVENDAFNNSVVYPITLTHTTTGTPANGIGTGLRFITETSNTNNEIGGLIEVVTTDVTSGSEDFDFVFKTMAAGATAAEKLRIKSTGEVDVAGNLIVSGGRVTLSAASNRDKYRLWNNNTYIIGLENSVTYGGIDNEKAMTFQMDNNSSQGFWWGDSTHTTAQGAMALTTDGKLSVAHSLRLGYGESDTTTPGATFKLDVNGNIYATGIDFGEVSIESTTGIDSWKYNGNLFSTTSEDSSITEIFIDNTNGAYLLATGSLSAVYRYAFTTAYKVDTLSYLESLDVSAEEFDVTSLFVKADGTKIYVVGTNSQSVHQYDLSTAWNLSTASYVGSKDISVQDTLPYGLFFKPDGTKMYVLGQQNTKIYEYNLGTAWTVSTATYSQQLNISAKTPKPTSMKMTSDGITLYILDSVHDAINKFTLSSAWNITSATHADEGDISTITSAISVTSPIGFDISSSANKVFVACLDNDKIFEYDTTSESARVIGNRLIVDEDVHVKNNLIVYNNVRVHDALEVAKNLAVNGTSITTVSTTFNLLNTTVDNLNIGGAASFIDLGSGTSLVTLANDASVQGDLTVVGTLTGTLTGNASTASAWATGRTITLTGDVTGVSGSFDGSGNLSFATTIAANSVALGSDTTGNYVATVAAGTPGVETSSSGLTIVSVAGEGTATTIAHADTSTLTGAQGTAGIAAITVDGYGHVTAVTTATYLTSFSETDTLDTVTTRGATTSNNITVGDIAVNGGDITTNQTTFGLIDTTATTVNAFGATTTLNLGYNSTAASTTNISIGATATSTTKTINLGTGGASGSTTTINIGSASGGTTTVNNNLTVTGNLTVNGTTTTVNSTTVTVDDPILTLGGDTAPSSDDNKDRGVEFRWHNGTSAKVGFFGFDDSTGQFTFIPDATNTSEVFSGTKGTLDVASITGSAASWTTGRTITLTGDVTGVSGSFDGSGNLSFATTIAANSVALGTDTTGNYVASITNGNYITGGDGGSEGAGLTLAVDATTTNTASKVVARDSSGNFAAGTITAALSGNATTATTLATARTIAISGDVTGTATSFNGSADITISAGITADSIVNADINSAAAIADTKLATISTAGKVSNSATTATAANTASAIVARDASGNFTAGTITAALSGNASTATTAAAWTTGRTITLTGDVTGVSGSFDGSGNLSFATTIAANSVALGTDTTGNYVATVAAGTPGVQSGTSGLTISATAGEGTAATISHADTSTQATVSNSGRTYVQSITLDDFGHITAISSASETVTDTNTTYSISTETGGDIYSEIIRLTGSDASTDDVTLAVGATGSTYGLTIAESGDTITFAHADTSTLTGAQGSAGIAAITVDEMGHVTAVTTATYLTSQANNFATVAIGADAGYTWGTANTNTNQTADSATDTITIVRGLTGTTAGIDLFTNTVAGTDAIKIAHADTSSLSGAQGSAGIAAITVDEMGHVTAVTTATYLTSQSSDFGTITVTDTDSGYTWGATGSAVADTAGDTLTLVSGTGINIDVDATNDAIRITNTFTESDTLQNVTDRGATTSVAVSITNATNATTTSSGALIVTGGVGIGGDLFVGGGDISAGNVATNLLAGNTTTAVNFATAQTSGALTIGGTAQTGTITLDRSTSAHTLNIATGVNTSGTKTVNIATGSSTTGVTALTLGSTNSTSSTIIQAGSGKVRFNIGSVTLYLPTADGSNGQVLKTDGAGNLSFDSVDSLSGGIANIVEDTSPQLGGNLDVNGQSIVSVSNGNILITPNGTGYIQLDGLNWPTADGANGYLLQTNGAGQLSWSAAGSNTTYTISAETATNAVLRLTGSDAVTDDVAFVGSGIVSVARTDANTITITGTEADTLATVTGRGASTATAIAITNTTSSTTVDTGALTVDGGVGLNGNLFVGGTGNIAGAGTITGNLTVSGGTITAGNVATTLLGGNTTTAVNFATAQTSGALTIGGTAQTGTITLDRSTVAHTLNIATGVNTSGVTKTINFGTGGASGSTTAINIGSSTSGATNTVNIYGDLTVTGTTTYVNTTTLNVGDNIITLNADEAGVPSQNAGIEIERGTNTNTALIWNETTDRWQFTNDGSTYFNIPTSSEYGVVNDGTLTLAVSGNGLTGSATFTANQSGGSTFTVASNATNANTVSTIVFRDASGNFSAGTITAALSGNATTASAWATGRTITLTGDVTGTSGSFDGSGNLSFATTIAANSVALGSDTTGNYVATVAAGTPGVETSSSGLTISATAGEGTAATIAHADTSTLTGAQGTAGIAAITLDGFGHVTAVTTATYLTAEADTLDTVTTRGATTANSITVGDIAVNGGDITTNQTTFNLVNATATTLNIGGAATTLTIGNTATAAQTVNMFTASTGASTYNFGTGATATATTKTLNIGTGGAAGSTTNVNIGSSVAGTTTISSPNITISGLADTATTATHYYVETGSTGNILPKTLANVRTEIVTTAAVNAAAATTVGTVTSGTWNATAITDTKLATISTAGKVSNSATTATNANTANAIVARDASGNFSAGTITSAAVDTTTAASHYYVETASDGAIRPKTLANVRTEIVTTAAVNAAAATTVGTVTSGIWNAGAVSSTGAFKSTLTGVTTTGGGQVYLNGATSNRVDFNINGVAAPAFTTRSAGTKVVYYPAVAAAAVDYAVGINTSTLWHSVPTASATEFFRWYGGTTIAATLTGAGTFTATADVCAYSDVRLKDNIEVISDPLDKVLKLRGVTFTRNDLDDNRTHMGVIAQEVEEVIPEVVITGDDGIKTVAYGNMVGLLIEAVKELTNQNKELLARIEQLEKK